MSHAKNKYTHSLIIITSLFFLFGFITCLNDVLMPHLKGAFTLNWQQAALIQFAFFSAYFFASIPSSRFCEKFGFQTGLWSGLLITAFGAFGLMCAAFTEVYLFFLLSLLILASGITLIQVAANPYVTLLGDPKTASSRLTLVQGFNSLGTTVAPIFGSVVILSTTNADSVQKQDMAMTIILIILAAFIFALKLPRFEINKKDELSWSELLRNKKLKMGSLAIFTYVGAEVSIGSYMVGWLQDPFVTALNIKAAANLVAFYWGGAMIGRFLGAPLLAKFNPALVLQYFALSAILLITISMTFGGNISQWSILGVGLFNSIMFPTIFSISIAGLKEGAKKASGLLCTSIVGGAIVPFIQGSIADTYGLRTSFIMPIICYGYLAYFAYYIHKRSSTT
ncbi:MAG: sugar MFS transporter [bacterium]|nr:sugar MFS transporter [bacterium]